MIIALGIVIFIGMCSSALCLEITKDAFFEDAKLADIYVQVQGIPDAGLSSVKDIEGVRSVNGRYAADVRINRKDSVIPVSVNLNAYDPDAVMDLFFFSGDAPKGDDIYLGKHMQRAYNYEIGDTIELIYNGKARRFTYRGTAQTPSLLEVSLSVSGYVDGSSYDIAVISKESMAAFTGKEGMYTDLSIGLQNGYSYEDLEQPLRSVLSPYGLLSIQKQEKQDSIFSVNDAIGMILNVGYVLPVIFLAVAVFMLYVIIKKLVDRDRTLIGAMKAFGVSDGEMISSYLLQGTVLGLVGATVGVILGWPIGSYLFYDTANYYSFPNQVFYVPPVLIAAAYVISVATGMLASFLSVRSILSITPSDAMRPPAPREASEIEVPGFITKRAGIMGKIAVRATTQNPLNGFLIIFAIAFAIGMSTALYSVPASVDDAISNYYDDAAGYNILLNLEGSVDPVKAGGSVLKIPHVLKGEPRAAYSAVIYHGGLNKITGITAVPEDSELLKILDHRGDAYSLNDGGIVIDRGTAEYLMLEEGDEVEVMISSLSERRYKTFVSAVITQSLGESNYMSIKAVADMTGRAQSANAVMVKAEEMYIDEVCRSLQDSGEIISFSVSENERAKLETEMGSMITLCYTMSVFGMIAGIIMVYNISMINFRERIGELGTILILGRSEKDIGKMLFIEQMMYFAAGSLLGLLLIRVFSKLVQELISADYMYIDVQPVASNILLILIACFVLVCVSSYRQYIAVTEIKLTDILKERC